MSSLLLTLVILAITLVAFLFLFLFYLVYLSVKLSKICDKVEFIIDDIIIKLENLNPSIDSLKKLFNYIDAFDLIFKKNLKSGLTLLRRNSFVLFKLLKIFQDLLIKKESKKTIFSEIFSQGRGAQVTKTGQAQQKKIKKTDIKKARKLKKYQQFLTEVQKGRISKMDFESAGKFISQIINRYKKGTESKGTKKT